MQAKTTMTPFGVTGNERVNIVPKINLAFIAIGELYIYVDYFFIYFNCARFVPWRTNLTKLYRSTRFLYKQPVIQLEKSLKFKL